VVDLLVPTHLRCLRSLPARLLHLSVEPRSLAPQAARMFDRKAAMARAAVPASAFQTRQGRVSVQITLRGKLTPLAKSKSRKRWMKKVCCILPCALLHRSLTLSIAAKKHAAFVRARGRHYSNEAEAMKVLFLPIITRYVLLMLEDCSLQPSCQKMRRTRRTMLPRPAPLPVNRPCRKTRLPN